MPSLSEHPTPAKAYELAATYAALLRHVYGHPDYHYKEPPTATSAKIDAERMPKGLFFTADFLQNTYVSNVLVFLPDGATRKCKELGNPWAYQDPNYTWEWTFDAATGTMRDAEGKAVAAPFPKLSAAKLMENTIDLSTRNFFAKKLLLENGTDPKVQAMLGGRSIDFGEAARAAAAKLD